MTRRWSLQDAGEQWPVVVAAVRRGELVELTDAGRPVAVITPLGEPEIAAARAAGFWETLDRLRREYDTERLDIGPEDFAGLRDRSPGRDVVL